MSLGLPPFLCLLHACFQGRGLKLKPFLISVWHCIAGGQGASESDSAAQGYAKDMCGPAAKATSAVLEPLEPATPAKAMAAGLAPGTATEVMPKTMTPAALSHLQVFLFTQLLKQYKVDQCLDFILCPFFRRRSLGHRRIPMHRHRLVRLLWRKTHPLQSPRFSWLLRPPNKLIVCLCCKL